MTRLGRTALDLLPGHVAKPAYDRGAVQTGIVHLGVGAFHRAHQAVYCDDVLASGDLAWGIAGVSLRSPDMRDALAPQDFLYGLVVRDGTGERARVIGSLTGIAVAPGDPARVLAMLAAPATRIVTLTVTEKGYCHDPATGVLDEDHPDIRHDLASPHAPRSVPGFLVEAMRLRREGGLAQPTMLSCDNLPANGRTARRILVRFAELRDPDLGAYVADVLRAPSTMVDRIVPATTEADRVAAARIMGLDDAWPVIAEPFSQWVVEDDFPAGRPDWDAHGAEFVRDVAPFEEMKLRLLNASHSAIAYLGYLAGYETVSEAIADPAMAAFVRGLMDEEVTPVLAVPPGTDLAGYKAALMERFANPALSHRTWQIAMDGSQKLPQRILATVRARLVQGAAIDRLALAVAAWMRYAAGLDERGAAIDVRDPLSDRFPRLGPGEAPDAAGLASRFLTLGPVFGDDLAHDPRFVEPVVRHLGRLLEMGAAACLRQIARLH